MSINSTWDLNTSMLYVHALLHKHTWEGDTLKTKDEYLKLGKSIWEMQRRNQVRQKGWDSTFKISVLLQRLGYLTGRSREDNIATKWWTKGLSQ